MKKWLKITLIVFGSIVIFILIISLIISPIAHSYIEKIVKKFVAES